MGFPKVYPGKAMAMPSAGVSPAADGRLVWRPCVPFTSLLRSWIYTFPPGIAVPAQDVPAFSYVQPLYSKDAIRSFPRRYTCLPKPDVLILQEYLCFSATTKSDMGVYKMKKNLKTQELGSRVCESVSCGSRVWMVLGAPNQCQAPESLNSSQDGME